MGHLIIDINKLEMAASKLRAMAHPMRIAIIDLLNTHTKLSVTEIYEKLDIEQASASHHLNILKNKGVLESKREGKHWLTSRLIHRSTDALVDRLTR